MSSAPHTLIDYLATRKDVIQQSKGDPLVGITGDSYGGAISLMSAGSFRNAVRVLQACGGSTNAIIHLLALSGRVDGKLTLDQIVELGEGFAVILDVEPSGSKLIKAFDAAGGLPALIHQLGDNFEADEFTALGNTWSENLFAPTPDSVIATLDSPIYPTAAFGVVFGSLAPNGALNAPKMKMHSQRMRTPLRFLSVNRVHFSSTL